MRTDIEIRGRWPILSAALVREHIEKEVEFLIEYLDALDGDENLEANPAEENLQNPTLNRRCRRTKRVRR